MSDGGLEVFARSPAVLVRSPPADIIIADTGALVHDIRYGARNNRLTSLLAAIEMEAAVVFIASSVLAEIEPKSKRNGHAAEPRAMPS